MSSDAIPFDGSVVGLSSNISVFLVLISTTLVLRFVARMKQHARLGIDDWLAIIPWLCFTVFFCLSIYGMVGKFKGVNMPPNPKDYASPREIEKVDWSTDLASIIALGSIRLSGVFFYRRVFCTGRRDWFSIATVVMIVLIVVWVIGLLCASFLFCDGSISRILDEDLTCGVIPYLYALAYSSMVLDLLVIVLPIPRIWSLHTTPIRKISISAVFLLAGAGFGASMANSIILYLIITRNIPAIGTHDIYIVKSKRDFYQYLEVGLGATAINLPSLWYFLKDGKPQKVLHSAINLITLRPSSSSSSSNTTISKDEANKTCSSSSERKININQTTHSISSFSLESMEQHGDDVLCARDQREMAGVHDTL